MPEPSSVRDVLRRGAAALRAAAFETPDLDAALLLGHLLGTDRAALYARSNEPVDRATADAFAALIERRRRGVPVAYLVGQKEFMGLPFTVGEAVLVPRPETEHLVEWTVTRLRRHAGARVVDVGTGSGAIAVALAAAVGEARVVASDLSADALAVARMNARANGVAAQIAFVRGDLLSWLGAPICLVVANLPYLTADQVADPGIAYEPRLALAGGGGDGFSMYRALIPQVAARLLPGGAFAFEIDPAQAEIAVAACGGSFPDAVTSVHRDLAGLPRFVTVETAGG